MGGGKGNDTHTRPALTVSLSLSMPPCQSQVQILNTATL